MEDEVNEQENEFYSVDLTPYCTEKQLELLIKVDNYINGITANLKNVQSENKIR